MRYQRTQNMKKKIDEIGFHYLPMQWDEYRKLWRYEEWNRQWAKYKDRDLSKTDKAAIKNSIFSNIDATLEIMGQAVEADPLKYYVPTGDNQKVIENFAHSLDGGASIAYVSCFAGNGIGKTKLSEAILLNLVRGVQSPWFDYPIFHDFPLKHKTILYC